MAEQTTTQRLYTCCPDSGCNAYRDALHFLKQWGVEPALGDDDGGHYLEFSTPEDWPAGRAREFEAALREWVAEGAPEPTQEQMAHEFAHEIIVNCTLRAVARFPGEPRRARQLMRRGLALAASHSQWMKLGGFASDEE